MDLSQLKKQFLREERWEEMGLSDRCKKISNEVFLEAKLQI